MAELELTMCQVCAHEVTIAAGVASLILPQVRAIAARAYDALINLLATLARWT